VISPNLRDKLKRISEADDAPIEHLTHDEAKAIIGGIFDLEVEIIRLKR
jgi:hypothetical protein